MIRAMLAFALLTAAVPVFAQNEGGTVMIRGARIFDGERMIGVRDVRVDKGRIVEIGHRLRAATGVEVIDGKGKTLLPGLIDSHVHVFPTAAEDALRFGVTTEFDMFTFPDPAAMKARRDQRASYARTDKADVWTAGRGVTLPGAHPTGLSKGMGWDMPTLKEDGDADAFIKAEVDEGSDYIKVFQDAAIRDGKPRFPEYSPRQLKAIIDGAHANGRKAIVHVSTEKDAADVFGMGADAIAHMFDDRPASKAIVRLAKDKSAVIIATLSVLASASGSDAGTRLAADPSIKPLLSPAQSMMIAGKFPRFRPDVLKNALVSVNRFHTGGVTILAGTDAPNPGTAHGPSIHEELALLVEAGLTPAQALGAATAKPADFFGADDRGRIARGKRADLILVDGDPTKDITLTRRLVAIWKNGYPIDRMKMSARPSAPGN